MTVIQFPAKGLLDFDGMGIKIDVDEQRKNWGTGSVEYLESIVAIMKAALARLEISEDRALGAEEENQMTTKSKLKAAPRATKETELAPPGREIVDAQDVLGDASNLADALNLMALKLNDYESGAFCAVTNALKESLCQGLDLIEAHRKKAIALPE